MHVCVVRGDMRDGTGSDEIFSDLDRRPTPGVFCTCSYNHARRLRLEKLSPNGFLNHFWIQVAATAMLCNGHSPADTSVCSGVTAKARNGRCRWPKATALFWGLNVYRVLSQLLLK